jgi:arylsulfatase A-like enzyme
LEQAKNGRPLFSFVHLGELHAPGNYSKASDPYQRYLDTVRVVDGHVGRILELIDAHGLSESTIVVFNADHGEEFREHGGLSHALTLYEEAVHVPLVIRVPAAGPGRTDNVISAFDVMPTLFDALGIQKPANILGQSLYPALCGQPIPHDLAVGRTYNPTPLFVPKDQVVVHKTYLLRSNEKLILDHPTGSIELYDLHTDPDERTNLYGQDVLRDQEFARALDLWLAIIDEPEVFSLIPARPQIRKPLVDLYEGWHR